MLNWQLTLRRYALLEHSNPLHFKPRREVLRNPHKVRNFMRHVGDQVACIIHALSRSLV